MTQQEAEKAEESLPYGLRTMVLHLGPKWFLAGMFRWEWRIAFQYKLFGDHIQVADESHRWRTRTVTFTNRADARRWARQFRYDRHTRNMVLERRRVQRQWETYGKLRTAA